MTSRIDEIRARVERLKNLKSWLAAGPKFTLLADLAYCLREVERLRTALTELISYTEQVESYAWPEDTSGDSECLAIARRALEVGE